MDVSKTNSRNGDTSGEVALLTREQIIWAYRVLLDRDPETDKVIQDAGSYGALKKFLDAA
jgi:hypothetical protein